MCVRIRASKLPSEAVDVLCYSENSITERDILLSCEENQEQP